MIYFGFEILQKAAIDTALFYGFWPLGHQLCTHVIQIHDSGKHKLGD